MISEHLFVKHVVALDLGLLPCPLASLSGRQTAAAGGGLSFTLLVSPPLNRIDAIRSLDERTRTDGQEEGSRLPSAPVPSPTADVVWPSFLPPP